MVYDNYFKTNNSIFLNNISPSLFGQFNIENILASYAVSKIMNIDKYDFTKTIKNFIGLPYRLEIVYENKYLKIINNSKATNVDASVKSIFNYNNISFMT